MRESHKYILDVDMLKIIATIIVFICHVYVVYNDAFDFELASAYFLLKAPAWAAIWMFMFLSGHNAFLEFSTAYNLTFYEIIKYYSKRFINIIIPTWTMILIVYVLVCPGMVDITDIMKFMLCAYRGHGGVLVWAQRGIVLQYFGVIF